MRRKVYIVGGAHSPFVGKHNPRFIWKGHPEYGTRDNPTIEEHITTAVRGALESTGVEGSAVERGYLGNFLGELFCQQGLLGAAVAGADPGFDGKPFLRIEAACASGAAAVTSCVEAIAAGSDVTLAVGAEVETTVKGELGADYMARACHYPSERALDKYVFPYLFARRNKAYKEAYGGDDSDTARVVAKAYSNANLNPNAHMQAVKVSFEEANTISDDNGYFLKDPEVREHIRILDCTHFSDGASAVILASEEGLAKLGVDKASCTEIVGYSLTTSSLTGDKDPRQLRTVAKSAQRAYAQAGLTPADIDVAEVHDCFSITELQMYEAAGFAKEGEGYKLIRDGQTLRDGRIPVNTGGGLIAFGHPVGATGVKQVFEIYRQMKGKCGDYQLANAPTHGASFNMGGDDKNGVTIVQRNLG